VNVWSRLVCLDSLPDQNLVSPVSARRVSKKTYMNVGVVSKFVAIVCETPTALVRIHSLGSLLYLGCRTQVCVFCAIGPPGAEKCLRSPVAGGTLTDLEGLPVVGCASPQRLMAYLSWFSLVKINFL
jgi:hypothetical protein